ncbi:MAG: hypothetical protein AB8H80_21335 [Planctomycetota bacterium]
MNQNTKVDSLFRQLTPLFLLVLLLAVLLEPWLPYIDWAKATFGEQIVLKTAVVFLIAYVLLLWGESLRLHGLLTGVLEAFKTFRQDGGQGGGGASRKASNNPKARIEAARLLIAAMRSGDASIRETSHHNLVRLVGQDLGTDADAWQKWLDAQV